MRKGLVAALFLSMILFFGACSATWSGVKHDTKENYESTKSVIHKATEPN